VSVKPPSSPDIQKAVYELADLLKTAKLSISVAESCSGGLLAKMLTDLPGSSAYFLAGVVAYSNNAKSVFLNVPSRLIDSQGAVSAEVAEAMAKGMLTRSGSDLALSITGIAGPDGGSDEKPLGTVYLGLADINGCKSRLLKLSGNRDKIRIDSAGGAIDWATSHIHETVLKSEQVCR
jgi:nicotinamide-nucleotide amidase